MVNRIYPVVILVFIGVFAALFMFLSVQLKPRSFECQFEIMDIRNESCPHQQEFVYSMCNLRNSIKADCQTLRNTSIINCTMLEYRFSNEEFAECNYHQETEYYYSYDDVVSRVNTLQSYETCYYAQKKDSCSDNFVVNDITDFILFLILGIVSMIAVLVTCLFLFDVKGKIRKLINRSQSDGRITLTDKN